MSLMLEAGLDGRTMSWGFRGHLVVQGKRAMVCRLITLQSRRPQVMRTGDGIRQYADLERHIGHMNGGSCVWWDYPR